MAYAGIPVQFVSGTAPTGVAPESLLLVGGTPAATTTARGGVLKQTAPAAAAVPFADLTAAANSFNALRAALISAGVLQ
jgi:hypothetical protein